MPEDIIKGKIIFEGGGALGKAGTTVSGGGGGFVSQAGGEAVGHMVTQGKSMAKIAKSSLGKLGLIAGAVMAVAKASPQLAATLSILFKSIMLALRPIADILSMFIRPLAIFMLRLFVPLLRKWYNLKLGEGVAGDAGEFIGDKLGVAGKLAEGDPGGAVGLKAGQFMKKMNRTFEILGIVASTVFGYIGNEIKELFTHMWGTIKDVWAATPEWFAENVSGPIKEKWGEFTEMFSENVIEPIKEKWKLFKEAFNEAIIVPIQDAWKSMLGYIDEKFMQPLQEAWRTIYTFIDDHVVQPIKDAWLTIVDWFDAHIIQPIKDAFRTLVNFFIDLANALLPGNPIRNVQTGGYIPETGMYNLHQGETVIPAHMQGMTMNSSPNITINANINSDMDLQALADRLSGIMMESLQRRNSYTFT